MYAAAFCDHSYAKQVQSAACLPEGERTIHSLYRAVILALMTLCSVVVDDREAATRAAEEDLGNEKGPAKEASERPWAVGSGMERRCIRPILLQQKDW